MSIYLVLQSTIVNYQHRDLTVPGQTFPGLTKMVLKIHRTCTNTTRPSFTQKRGGGAKLFDLRSNAYTSKEGSVNGGVHIGSYFNKNAYMHKQTTREVGVRIVDRKNLNWCTPFSAVSL